MSDSLQHAVIILAAGASRRMGTPKQLLLIDNETLLNRTIRIASTTCPAQTLLVLGHHANEIYASVTHQGIERIDCADWQMGMSASLHAGIQHVAPHCGGALILLCDQPALSTAHLRRLLNAWYQQSDHAVATAYANTKGVPALLPRSWFAKLHSIQGDQGARELLRCDSSVIGIEAPELVHDVDSAANLPSNFA